MGVIILDAKFSECRTNRERIIKIDALIDQLLETAMVSIAAGNIAEYDLDTGQTKTRMKYTTTASVIDTINKYEALKQVYVSRVQGRVFRLMDESNFKV